MEFFRRYFLSVSFKYFFIFITLIFCLGLINSSAIVAQEEVYKDPGIPVEWETLSRQQKVKMIADTITTFRSDTGIVIRKEPGFYVEQIDAVYLDNLALGDESIGSIFRMLAITYRDFDNGTDPEDLIRAELGEEKYLKTFQNKQAVEEIYQEYLRKKRRK